MLTKRDLNALGSLIDTKLETKFEQKLSPITNDIGLIKKDVRKLRKDLKTTIHFFDNRDLESRKNLDKTRTELNLQELNYV